MRSGAAGRSEDRRTRRSTNFSSPGRARAHAWIAAACLALGLPWSPVASADTATFDTLAEGALDVTFSDGGITFYNFDDRAGGPGVFSCEQADGTLSGTGFSAPNALGFGSWVPGPYAAFSQVGSFWFRVDTVQTFASIDVFEWMSYGGNTISLEAYFEGDLVNSMTVEIPGNGEINHWNLSVSGVPFDSLRVNGAGPYDRGVFIGLADNAVIAPEPAAGLGLVVLCALRRRR